MLNLILKLAIGCESWISIPSVCCHVFFRWLASSFWCFFFCLCLLCFFPPVTSNCFWCLEHESKWLFHWVTLVWLGIAYYFWCQVALVTSWYGFPNFSCLWQAGFSSVLTLLLHDSAGTNSTVCQEKLDGAKRYSLGDIFKQTLRFADRHLTLTYEHGDQCSNKLNRTTIIMFICDYHVDKGQPVFTTEEYCFYYFEWRTKYACAPSRRTGTQCRVEGPNGLRFDLSELVRMNNQSNWVGLDGETSSSDRKIFLNVCGGLNVRDETRQCDRTAAVCMIEKGTWVSLGRYTDPPTLNQDNSIKLVYTQGSVCKKDNLGKSILRNSTITFICQPGDLASAPVLVSHSDDNCHYEFMWETGKH